MHKKLENKYIDLNHLTQQKLYDGLAVLNQNFANQHLQDIKQLHSWDYGFWLRYLDLQRQALNLKSQFEDLDIDATDHAYHASMKIFKTVPQDERPKACENIVDKSYEPVIKAIVSFWQAYPTATYGSQIYLHAMAKTFFRHKISHEEPAQGRQIKRTLNHLADHDWNKLVEDLRNYPGWWN